MRALNIEEQRNISGGKTYYHWLCRVNGFISTSYTSSTTATSNGKTQANKYGHTWGSITVLLKRVF